MLNVCWTIFILYLYIINNRLELDLPVCSSSLPTTIGAVTRISLCQPGVEDLEKEFFTKAQKSEYINI